jgi:hypothetical protein
MNPRIRFTKKQLEWYRSIKDFDTTPWWLPKIKGQKLDHPELFWAQKKLAKSNRHSFASEPVLWEILRRHPDLGPESSWKAERKNLREAEKTGVFSLPIHPLTFETQITLVLHRLGHKTWPSLEEKERLEFRRNLGAFLRLGEFNRSRERVASDPIVADLAGDLREQGLQNEWESTLLRCFEPPICKAPAEIDGKYSFPFASLDWVVGDAAKAGYIVMVLRIDPGEGNLDRIEEKFISLYKKRLPPKVIRCRVRTEDLCVISDAEKRADFASEVFGELFSPFWLKVSEPPSPKQILNTVDVEKVLKKRKVREGVRKKVKKK